MLKKHLTVLLLLVMAVGAFAQPIPSGTARYEALGFNPFIMDAATDINRNPAWGGMYRNYTFGDIGRGAVSDLQLSEQYAGVNFGLGKNFTAGMILNREDGAIFGGSIRGHYGGHGIGAPIVPFEGLIGYTANNKKLHVGLAPYFAMWSRDITNGTPNYDSTLKSMIFGGSLGIVAMMKNGWVEGNVDVRLNSYKFEYDTSGAVVSSDEVDGGLELAVHLRGFFMVSKPGKVNLVPYAHFGMFNWKPKYNDPNARLTEYKHMDIYGGVGINMPVLDDGMLAGGLSVGFRSDEENSDNDSLVVKFTHFTLPQFNLGLEWAFTDWLTGRAGYSRAVTSDKTTSDLNRPTPANTREVTQLSASNPDQTVTLGLGMHFGRFSFDGLIGERVFKHGAYILSGHQDDLYSVISASYNFNK